MERISVMILAGNPEEKSELESMLSNIEYINVAREPKNLQIALSIIEAEGVNVILVSEDFDGDGYAICEGLAHEYPEKGVIILTRELHEDTVHRAMFSGARDVVVLPVEPGKLLDSIYKVNTFAVRQGKGKKEAKTSSVNAKLGRVFTFFSTKGGVGKSFMALNFAAALQEETKKRVVLVDFDLEFGTLALSMNLQPRFSINDVVNDIRNIDAEFIESYLTPHQSGIRLLSSTLDPRNENYINAEHIQLIIKTLQGSYDFIVVDMPARFSDTVSPGIQYADKLFLVATPEITAIRNVKASMGVLESLNYPKSKIQVVLNRQHRRNDIKVKDIEKTLDQTINLVVEEDHLKVPYSLNQGVPYVLKYTRSGISRSLRKYIQKNITVSPKKS
ncbi:AAA family ATPase [Proteiniclasticum sp. BAD-10]|uniref:Stage 0 sporulation protein A homolog n=1 Tax=Proteiniclasticum sediminis TaxID=2804028 RepID=A0A941CP55_9CLOT|nr:AAA family ATPase [Proteiniclasticum sediminis]MBR0575258.1 AAA family ATPase [Proteiniclasticum sediminis]